MAKKALGTTPTQIRLTIVDKAMLEDIRKWEGLPSIAAAVRYSLQRAHHQISDSREFHREARKRFPKKSKREA